MSETMMSTPEEQRRRNLRLALVLASIALTFFAGFVIKTAMFSAH